MANRGLNMYKLKYAVEAFSENRIILFAYRNAALVGDTIPAQKYKRNSYAGRTR